MSKPVKGDYDWVEASRSFTTYDVSPRMLMALAKAKPGDKIYLPAIADEGQTVPKTEADEGSLASQHVLDANAKALEQAWDDAWQARGALVGRDGRFEGFLETKPRAEVMKIEPTWVWVPGEGTMSWEGFCKKYGAHLERAAPTPASTTAQTNIAKEMEKAGS